MVFWWRCWKAGAEELDNLPEMRVISWHDLLTDTTPRNHTTKVNQPIINQHFLCFFVCSNTFETGAFKHWRQIKSCNFWLLDLMKGMCCIRLLLSPNIPHLWIDHFLEGGEEISCSINRHGFSLRLSIASLKDSQSPVVLYQVSVQCVQPSAGLHDTVPQPCWVIEHRPGCWQGRPPLLESSPPWQMDHGSATCTALT